MDRAKFFSRLGNEMSGQPIQDITEVMESGQQSVEQIPETEVTELPLAKGPLTNHCATLILRVVRLTLPERLNPKSLCIRCYEPQ